MAEAGVNADQAEFWNSDPAQNWIRHEAILEALHGEVQARLMARADPRPGERALDIGCGTGSTTLAVAGRVGPDGHVLGIDISGPMLDRARQRAAGLPQVAFLRADAQVHRFDQARLDLALSRFGVMFFDDPVAAFRNIAGALRTGGRLAFAAWGPIADNPWFAIPRDAAVARLGPPAPQDPTAPGPTAFADRDRVRRILEAAGLTRVEAEAERVELVWPGDLETLVGLTATLGPAARILREKGGGPEDEAAIRDAVAAGLGRFRDGGGVRVPALLNLFTARRG